jgi:methyl-accepting chemotaxis protein
VFVLEPQESFSTFNTLYFQNNKIKKRKGKKRLSRKQMTGIVSRQDNSVFRKRGCLENLPEVLFLIIQAFSNNNDYLNLMNTNLTAFQDIKSQTVRYTLSLLDNWDRVNTYNRNFMEASLMNLINSVKDKSKQVSMSFQDVKQQTVVKYAHLFEGIYKFYLWGSASLLSPPSLLKYSVIFIT